MRAPRPQTAPRPVAHEAGRRWPSPWSSPAASPRSSCRSPRPVAATRTADLLRPLPLRRRLRPRQARPERLAAPRSPRSPAWPACRPASSSTSRSTCRDLAEPAIGRLISVPDRRPPASTTLPARGPLRRTGPAAARCWSTRRSPTRTSCKPGDTLTAVINGRRQQLTIVGIALSPEYIFPIRPGDVLPDDKRFGVFWMGVRRLAAGLRHGRRVQRRRAVADARRPVEPEVIRRLDRLTERVRRRRGATAATTSFRTSFVDDEIAAAPRHGADRADASSSAWRRSC